MKMLNTVIVLVVWTIWKERNNRVFEGKPFRLDRMVEQIKCDAHNWYKGGQMSCAAVCLR
jgi:hypothetical protein